MRLQERRASVCGVLNGYTNVSFLRVAVPGETVRKVRSYSRLHDLCGADGRCKQAIAHHAFSVLSVI